MLKLSNISNLEIHTDEWRRGRLGKFTSSMIYSLMSDKFLTEDCVSYIYTRVGEEMTGVVANAEIDTPATNWGLLHENTAIKKFGDLMKTKFLIVQKLITIPDTRFGGTPDCILPKAKYSDGYDVETGEVKCYPSYSHFIRCVLCNTATELKEKDKKLYWQVIDQMHNCEALVGYAILFHPDFNAGGFKVIKFRKVELVKDFKFLEQRKKDATEKFEEIREKLMSF